MSVLSFVGSCLPSSTLHYRHDIYRYQERAQHKARPRATSLIVPQHTIDQDPAFHHIHEPGGFRRNYMLLKANMRGLEEPPVTSTFIDFLYLFGHFAGEDLEEDTDEEELAPIDEEAPLYVSPILPTTGSHSILRRDTGPRSGEGSSRVRTTHGPRMYDGDANESTPLISTSNLRRRSSRRSISRQRRSRRSSISSNGDATVSQAILMVR
jgi:solute carrier family 36 (proton-coupled amino acid transporter)